jgi:hypothetical protein
MQYLIHRQDESYLRSIGKRPENEVNILEQIKLDKQKRFLEDGCGENLLGLDLKTEGAGASFGQNKQPLTKWNQYKDNLFVMGDVA